MGMHIHEKIEAGHNGQEEMPIEGTSAQQVHVRVLEMKRLVIF